jgi:cation transport regulator ChaB
MMPYSSTDELPDQTSSLSSKQKRAFMHAFNSAVESGKDEKSAFKIAWAATGVSKAVREVRVREHEREDGSRVKAHVRRIGERRHEKHNQRREKRGLDEMPYDEWAAGQKMLAIPVVLATGWLAFRGVRGLPGARAIQSPPKPRQPGAPRETFNKAWDDYYDFVDASASREGFSIASKLDVPYKSSPGPFVGARDGGWVIYKPEAFKSLQGKNFNETLNNVESWLKGRPVEHGFVIDRQTGRILSGGRGNEMNVPILGPRLSSRDAERLVITHNHPQNIHYSGQDLLVQWQTRAREMRAVLPNGSVSRMEMKSWSMGDAGAIDRLTRAQMNILDRGGFSEQRLQRLAASGDTSELTAWLRRNESAYNRDLIQTYRNLELETTRNFRFSVLEGIVKMGVSDVTKSSAYAPAMDDLTITGEIAKVDDDKRQVFGWASVTELNGEPVVDLQNDYLETVELEKAAYDYVLNSRVGGEMHKRVKKDAPKQIGTLIESMVLTPEKIEKMGLPSETPRGWWIGFQVQDDDVWQSVKKGKYTGFSIHGLGKRLEKSFDEIGKGVLDRSEQEILGWIERVSEQIGVEPHELAAALDEFSETGEDADGDALHNFLMERFGSGQMLAKHMLGRHEQKDHDPTKGKAGHKRSEHGSSQDPDRIGGGRRLATGLAGAFTPIAGFPMVGAAIRGTSVFGRKNKQPTGSSDPIERRLELQDAWVEQRDELERAYNADDTKKMEQIQRSMIHIENQIEQTDRALNQAAWDFPDARSEKVGKSISPEEFLIAKAAERAKGTEEFLDNVEEIAKVLDGRDEAQFFDDFLEVAKHVVRVEAHTRDGVEVKAHERRVKRGERGDGEKKRSKGKIGAAIAGGAGLAALATPGGRTAARMFGQRGARAARTAGTRFLDRPSTGSRLEGAALNTLIAGAKTGDAVRRGGQAAARGGQAARRGAQDFYGGIARGGFPQASDNMARFAATNPSLGQTAAYGFGAGAPYGFGIGLMASGVDNIAQDRSKTYDQFVRRQRDDRRQRKLSKRQVEVLEKYLGKGALDEGENP